MGIVFGILILLYFILIGMKLVFYKDPKKAPVAVEKQEIKQDTVTADEDNEDLDEDELIAVLTAAVASSLNQSTYNLNIRSFRRIDQNSPVWNTVSRKEQIANRL
jgi:sodium pump decarboxylase gamma subunit